MRKSRLTEEQIAMALGHRIGMALSSRVSKALPLDSDSTIAAHAAYPVEMGVATAFAATSDPGAATTTATSPWGAATVATMGLADLIGRRSVI